MIVIDTNILSYLARAGCLDAFLAAFAGRIGSTPLVRAELERGVAAGHTVLAAAVAAFADGRITLIDLDQAEIAEMVALASQRRGLSMTDCSLFVAARTRAASLLTRERKLQRVAQGAAIPVMSFVDALNQAVGAGFLTSEQRDLARKLAHI